MVIVFEIGRNAEVILVVAAVVILIERWWSYAVKERVRR